MRKLSTSPNAVRMRERRRQIKEGYSAVEERAGKYRTLQEVADILGLSNQYVGRIEQQALAKLRRKLAQVWEDYQNDRQQSTRSSNGGRVPRVVPPREMGGYAANDSDDVSGDDDGGD